MQSTLHGKVLYTTECKPIGMERIERNDKGKEVRKSQIGAKKTSETKIGVGVAIGVALGAVMGVAVGNIAMGMSLGVVLGVSIGVAIGAGKNW